MDELQGIWADDTANYLTDRRHPVMMEENRRWLLERGRRDDEDMSPRERRQFDREMVAKYGEICPPPARTVWHLKIYDILDAQEERAAREKAAAIAAKNAKNEEVYVDEAI